MLGFPICFETSEKLKFVCIFLPQHLKALNYFLVDAAIHLCIFSEFVSKCKFVSKDYQGTVAMCQLI